MTRPKLALVTFPLCPYVQRSIITLEEKGVPHTRIDIDLANKPKWFLKLSPLGKVPLLIVDDHITLFESAVICEYLNEITPGSLLPESALDRAHHKAWIEFGSQLLSKIARLYTVKDKADFEVCVADLRVCFGYLNAETASSPYFSGEDFMLIDAVYASVFRYFDVFDMHVDLAVFTDLPAVLNWRANVMQRDSVVSAVDKQYPLWLKAFLLKKNSHISSLLKGELT